MKKYFWLMLLLIGFSFTYKVLADEVTQKTDGSFVGESPPKPINSSFVGDDRNSVDNGYFMGENLQKQTDHEFVGANTIQPENSYFSGDNSDRVEDTETDAPFEEDHTKKAKDGVFLGEDIQKKTDGSFSGAGYGK
jgi:hypothetical protein